MKQIELFKVRKYGLGDPYKSNEDAKRERKKWLMFLMFVINQHSHRQNGSYLALMKPNWANTAKKPFMYSKGIPYE